MSERPKDDKSIQRQIEPTQKSNEQLELILGQQQLSLTNEQRDRALAYVSKHSTYRPGAVRVCDTDCPLSKIGDCPWLNQLDAEDRRAYCNGKNRCPLESVTWHDRFKEYVHYVTDLYEGVYEENEIPDYELGQCQQLAYLRHMEFRAQYEWAADPRSQIDEPVPGTASEDNPQGLTRKVLNPLIDAYDKAQARAFKAERTLFKEVRERAKNVDGKSEERKRSLESLMKELEDNPAKFEGTRIRSALTSLNEKIQKNKERRIATTSKGEGG